MTVETELEGEASEVALTVRVPKGTLERIDALVRVRQNKIPRHSWLLEAIYEKLYREERVEGVLDIFWENSGEIGTAARYCLHFLPLSRRKGGPVAPMSVVGDDSLERYLVEWGFISENAKGWIGKLKADKSISISNVMMPANRVGPYGFKVAGLGIQRKLRDGRTAVLYHDHPRKAPDELRGDKIAILSATGYSEREAIITADGKVLIIRNKYIAPPAASVNVMWQVEEASKEEAEEFLDIRRQYTPD
jgi:hypothetical protein